MDLYYLNNLQTNSSLNVKEILSIHGYDSDSSDSDEDSHDFNSKYSALKPPPLIIKHEKEKNTKIAKEKKLNENQNKKLPSKYIKVNNFENTECINNAIEENILKIKKFDSDNSNSMHKNSSYNLMQNHKTKNICYRNDAVNNIENKSGILLNENNNLNIKDKEANGFCTLFDICEGVNNLNDTNVCNSMECLQFNQDINIVIENEEEYDKNFPSLGSKNRFNNNDTRNSLQLPTYANINRKNISTTKQMFSKIVNQHNPTQEENNGMKICKEVTIIKSKELNSNNMEKINKIETDIVANELCMQTSKSNHRIKNTTKLIPNESFREVYAKGNKQINKINKIKETNHIVHTSNIYYNLIEIDFSEISESNSNTKFQKQKIYSNNIEENESDIEENNSNVKDNKSNIEENKSNIEKNITVEKVFTKIKAYINESRKQTKQVLVLQQNINKLKKATKDCDKKLRLLEKKVDCMYTNGHEIIQNAHQNIIKRKEKETYERKDDDKHKIISSDLKHCDNRIPRQFETYFMNRNKLMPRRTYYKTRTLNNKILPSKGISFIFSVMCCLVGFYFLIIVISTLECFLLYTT